MQKGKKIRSVTKIFKTIILILVLIITIYCMVNHLGLIDDLDFGAGAYYYADIPEFTKYVNENVCQPTVPMSLLIILFLLWGNFIYKLWVWLEKDGNV